MDKKDAWSGIVDNDAAEELNREAAEACKKMAAETVDLSEVLDLPDLTADLPNIPAGELPDVPGVDWSEWA